jgi:hypothetical protein
VCGFPPTYIVIQLSFWAKMTFNTAAARATFYRGFADLGLRVKITTATSPLGILVRMTEHGPSMELAGDGWWLESE